MGGSPVGQPPHSHERRVRQNALKGATVFSAMTRSTEQSQLDRARMCGTKPIWGMDSRPGRPCHVKCRGTKPIVAVMAGTKPIQGWESRLRRLRHVDGSGTKPICGVAQVEGTKPISGLDSRRGRPCHLGWRRNEANLEFGIAAETAAPRHWGRNEANSLRTRGTNPMCGGRGWRERSQSGGVDLRNEANLRRGAGGWNEANLMVRDWGDVGCGSGRGGEVQCSTWNMGGGRYRLLVRPGFSNAYGSTGQGGIDERTTSCARLPVC